MMQNKENQISLTKSKLDWQPFVSLEDGLKQTIAYLKKNFIHEYEHSFSSRYCHSGV